MLSILGTDFIAHWAYEERISAHAQPAVKCELFYMYNLCWAYAERILSHTEHTRNEFHRMLSILGTDFIACWACAEMFKSRISLPIRIRFLKISCYRPLEPYGFSFCKKSIKKIHACVPLIMEGSGSIPLTSWSGSGFRRPKNMWSRWIQIRIGSESTTLVWNCSDQFRIILRKFKRTNREVWQYKNWVK